MTIKLTDNEWGILEHRLDIYDCIAECYADTMYVEAEDRGEKMTDEQHKAAYAVAYDAGSRLNCDIRNARQIDTDKLTDLDKWILADCLDGTTFFTDMDDAVADFQRWKQGTMSRGRALALRKAGRSLERKFNEAGIACRLNVD
jgi:hypothetical protein